MIRYKADLYDSVVVVYNKKYHDIIKTAPELLEVLEIGVQIQKDNYGNATNTHLAISDWVESAKKAIAKAKGE